MQCLCCGTCCSKYQPRLSIDEARSISQKLGIEWSRFLNEYADNRWPGTLSFLLRHVDGACLFLRRSTDNKQKLCSIHDIKPACCLEWTADLKNPECREGMQNIYGLEVDSSGMIKGSPENIKKFNLYNCSGATAPVNIENSFQG